MNSLSYKKNSCIKNAVCKIRTNLSINLVLFTNFFGGQCTSKIPCNRLVRLINKERYTILTYSTGNLLLTNLFYFNDLTLVFNYFNSFLLLCLKKGIAKTNDGSCRLRTEYLVENFQFSIKIPEYYFNNKRDDLYQYICTAFEKNVSYKKFVQKVAEKKNDKNFPAVLYGFCFERENLHILNYKSEASKKRHKDNFKIQTVSFHIFSNGIFIITGGQTKEDVDNIRNLLFEFLSYFFKRGY